MIITSLLCITIILYKQGCDFLPTILLSLVYFTNIIFSGNSKLRLTPESIKWEEESNMSIPTLQRELMWELERKLKKQHCPVFRQYAERYPRTFRISAELQSHARDIIQEYHNHIGSCLLRDKLSDEEIHLVVTVSLSIETKLEQLEVKSIGQDAIEDITVELFRKIKYRKLSSDYYN